MVFTKGMLAVFQLSVLYVITGASVVTILSDPIEWWKKDQAEKHDTAQEVTYTL